MTRLAAPRRLAAGVSGGADSTALALLAQAWGADVLALIVDHGLREGSAAEVAVTAERLAARGIESRVMTLRLESGAALQARARAARHEALAAAALQAGRLHLLLGHHAGDQAETVAMRAARGASGAEGIAAWAARDKVVLLRPLLAVRPQALRDYLTARGMEWVEDPSNQLSRFERVRVRQAGRISNPAAPEARQEREREAAAFLARFASIRPEGFAVVDAAAAPAAAVAALLRVVGGRDYPPGQAAVAAIAGNLRAATLGGVRISRSVRLGGWLFAREPENLAPPVPAEAGAVWDHRFLTETNGPAGAMLGGLGDDAKFHRKTKDLPSIVLRGMPCFRGQNGEITFPAPVNFRPPAPATFLPFFR